MTRWQNMLRTNYNEYLQFRHNISDLKTWHWNLIIKLGKIDKQLKYRQPVIHK